METLTELFNDYAFMKVDLMKVFLAFSVVLMSLLLKKVFANVILKNIKKLTSKTKTQVDAKIIWAIEKPAEFLFIVIGIYSAVGILGIPEQLEFFISALFRSIIAVSVFWALYRGAEIVTYLISKIVRKSGGFLDPILISFIQNSMRVVIVILAFIAVVQEWDYDVAGLLAGLGLGGLAFALAAQDTVANLFGGILIMLDRPFTIGDWIRTSEVEGTVEEIGFRSTKVRTFAHAIVVVPNSRLSKEGITNWSKMGKRQLAFTLGLTYSTTMEQMEECLEKIREMLRSHPEIDEEIIFAYFQKFGDSSLDIMIYCFTKTTKWEEFLKAQEDVNLKIMKILRDLNLSVAFPSRSIYIEKDNLPKNQTKPN